jgi:16S rRNA G966 N2-methylase RsmD
MSELVSAGLVQMLGDVKVEYVDDSAMIFSSAAVGTAVASLSFVKNSFEILASASTHNVDKAIRRFSDVFSAPGANIGPRKRGAPFRLMAHVDGVLTSIDPRARRALEAAVTARTGGRPQPRGSCDEYWVVRRRDLDETLLCLRLDQAHRPKAARPKGALSRELSTLLVLASDPRPSDTFLDPFGGSGALVEARIASPAKRVVYSDTALPRFLDQLRPLSRRPGVELRQEDALRLPSIADSSISKIVTDPPWGEFEKLPGAYSDFAASLSLSLSRVMPDNGARLVVLTSRLNAELMANSFGDQGFERRDQHRVLVSGHPAVVLVLVR